MAINITGLNGSKLENFTRMNIIKTDSLGYIQWDNGGYPERRIDFIRGLIEIFEAIQDIGDCDPDVASNLELLYTEFEEDENFKNYFVG